jgi:diadenosine tetraphosphatase ApaH/serine/threonine PP2A family protein phosphatase
MWWCSWATTSTGAAIPRSAWTAFWHSSMRCPAASCVSAETTTIGSRRHTWLLATDAFTTIESYSVDAADVLREAISRAGAALYGDDGGLPYEAFFDCVPSSHIQFFDTLRSYYQSPDCICTHGGLDPGVVSVQEQTKHALIWGGGGFPDEYDGPETVVYGHRNNAVVSADGWPSPAILGRTIGIDTISHGVLTAVRLPDGRVFQSARFKAPRADG